MKEEGTIGKPVPEQGGHLVTLSPNRVKVVGLLGGIGSGKSEVARLFQEAGAVVISGDALGHEALRQPELKARIVGRWGPGLLDAKGEVVRKKLGGIVFASPGERKVLETIVHPWIKERLREELARLKGDPAVPLVVVDAAIMLEAGWDAGCDVLVFVDVPREARLDRIARQRGWSAKEVEAREAAQLDLTAKARRAHYILDNSGSPEDLRRRVGDLLRQWDLPKPAGPQPARAP